MALVWLDSWSILPDYPWVYEWVDKIDVMIRLITPAFESVWRSLCFSGCCFDTLETSLYPCTDFGIWEALTSLVCSGCHLTTSWTSDLCLHRWFSPTLCRGHALNSYFFWISDDETFWMEIFGVEINEEKVFVLVSHLWNSKRSKCVFQLYSFLSLFKTHAFRNPRKS